MATISAKKFTTIVIVTTVILVLLAIISLRAGFTLEISYIDILDENKIIYSSLFRRNKQ